MTETLRRPPIRVHDVSPAHADRLNALTATAHPTVAILGLGYVGLPTALALESGGVDVIGVDVSEQRLAAIRSLRVDVIPEDLARLQSALEGDLLELTSNDARISAASAVIVCVPTPVDANLDPDLSILKAACDVVVRRAVVGQTIILTSTTYVGCTRDLLVEPLAERGLVAGRDVFVAFSPERIDPGNRTHPQDTVPRVLGGATSECAERAAHVIGRVAPRVHRVSSLEAAELTKLYENTFRAVNIALANELSEISGVFGVDAIEVVQAASTKPYGFMPFYPGTGVGGHCIPCDPHYLLWGLRAARVEAPLVERAMSSIASRPTRIVERAASLLAAKGQPVMGARVVVVGVAYKAGVEDVRESPALELIQRLAEGGADVSFVDPLVESIRLGDGTVLRSAPEPLPEDVDLAIVHVLQPGARIDWLERVSTVLDPAGALRRLVASFA
jgi:nucleotide sugar dehydrogenase